MTALVHGRVQLALHELRARPGPKLLLLHALHGSSAQWDDRIDAWPGSVFGLDFAGHGGSEWLSGGGYHPELFAADADAALASLGEAYVAGAGLGAYVALLVAGARPDLVPGALLLSGAGLEGGGASPDFAGIAARFSVELGSIGGHGQRHADAESGTTDPLVRTAETDVRPPDYAVAFAARARRLLLAADGIAGIPWWDAVRRSDSIESVPSALDEALRRLARVDGAG